MPPKFGKMKSLLAVIEKDAQQSKKKGEGANIISEKIIHGTQGTSQSILARSDDIEVPLINLIGNYFKDLILFFQNFILLSY